MQTVALLPKASKAFSFDEDASISLITENGRQTTSDQLALNMLGVPSDNRFSTVDASADMMQIPKSPGTEGANTLASEVTIK